MNHQIHLTIKKITCLILQIVFVTQCSHLTILEQEHQSFTVINSCVLYKYFRYNVLIGHWLLLSTHRCSSTPVQRGTRSLVRRHCSAGTSPRT